MNDFAQGNLSEFQTNPLECRAMLCHAAPQNSTQMSSNYEAIVVDSQVAGAGHLLSITQ